MVEESAVVDRKRIGSKLAEWGSGYLSQWDTLEVYLEEENYNVRTADVEGLKVIATKMFVPGCTPEKIAVYFDSPWTVIEQMNNRMVLTKVEDQGGYPTYHFMNEMPPMVYNRSTFVTFYTTQDEATGVKTICTGSEGNDHLMEQEAESVGSNVHSCLVGNYCRMTPKEGGYEVE